MNQSSPSPVWVESFGSKIVYDLEVVSDFSCQLHLLHVFGLHGYYLGRASCGFVVLGVLGSCAPGSVWEGGLALYLDGIGRVFRYTRALHAENTLLSF